MIIHSQIWVDTFDYLNIVFVMQDGNIHIVRSKSFRDVIGYIHKYKVSLRAIKLIEKGITNG